eukprot:10543201-Karenia_brevis.AAC.1
MFSCPLESSHRFVSARCRRVLVSAHLLSCPLVSSCSRILPRPRVFVSSCLPSSSRPRVLVSARHSCPL